VRGLRPALYLSIVHIWVHVRIAREEPRVDPACDIRGVMGGTADRPGERIVEDSVGHGHEGPRVVDREDIRVDLAIAFDVGACDPNYAPKSVIREGRDRVKGKILCCGVNSVVLPTPAQFGQKLSMSSEHTEVNGRRDGSDILWCPAEIVVRIIGGRKKRLRGRDSCNILNVSLGCDD